MEIRDLTPADRPAAIALWEEAGLTRPWNEPAADFDRALGGTTSSVLGAVDDDNLEATAMVGHDGHRGWVYYLAVSPVSRRRGLGRQMMQAAEAWLRGHHAVKMQVMVRRSNASALGFYERLGYEEADVTVLAHWLLPPE